MAQRPKSPKFYEREDLYIVRWGKIWVVFVGWVRMGFTKLSLSMPYLRDMIFLSVSFLYLLFQDIDVDIS
jgi:hypothetical protein